MVKQDHTAVQCLLASEPVGPRKPISIKMTRSLHLVVGLAIPAAPCNNSIMHGGVAAALSGFQLWLQQSLGWKEHSGMPSLNTVES